MLHKSLSAVVGLVVVVALVGFLAALVIGPAPLPVEFSTVSVPPSAVVAQ